MLTTQTATYVRLSDVLAYVGYPELMEDAPDIFNRVTWGDSMHTLVPTEYVLNMLYYWLDSSADEQWGNEGCALYKVRSEQLEREYTLVDMES
jgi:hypothetical protein